MKIMNRCAKAQCAAAGEKRLMDWIMQTLTQLGEHFGLVLIACVELAAAVALLIKGQHKKKGTPIQTAWDRGARDLMLQELDRRSDQVFILMRRSDLMPIAAVGNTQKMLGISLEKLQTNLMTLMQQMANRDASEQVWKSYRARTVQQPWWMSCS